MEIQERLALLYRLLDAAPPTATAEQALALICRTLEAVENEHCKVPRQDTPPLKFDGRMYSPQPDNIKVRDDGSMWIKTRRHQVLIRTNGGFVIYRETAHNELHVEFRKEGATR